MTLTESTLSSKPCFDGKLLHLHVDTVSLPNGEAASREVVEHPGGVCVVALTDTGEVVLVKQFRYPFHEVTAEIPAGKLEAGEEPLAAVQRELAEETGFVASNWRFLGKLYPTPGFCTEVDRLFLATGLTDLHQHPETLAAGEAMPSPDEDEFIQVETVPLSQAVDQVMHGEIPDAKTQIGLLMAARLWERNEL